MQAGLPGGEVQGLLGQDGGSGSSIFNGPSQEERGGSSSAGQQARPGALARAVRALRGGGPHGGGAPFCSSFSLRGTPPGDEIKVGEVHRVGP